jgi:tartrate dehydratase beta subunit/fumarate hydratase class I family protein
MKTETVKPDDLTVGDTILLNGQTYTVGRDTVQTGFFGATVRSLRIGTIERVLFHKFYKGEFLGFVSQQ